MPLLQLKPPHYVGWTSSLPLHGHACWCRQAVLSPVSAAQCGKLEGSGGLAGCAGCTVGTVVTVADF